MAKEKKKDEKVIDEEAKTKEAEAEEVEKTEEKEKAEKEEPDPLKELQKDLDAAKEAHIRTLAEYDNYRKRSVKEKEAAYNDSKANVLKEFLPIIDNFERALNADGDFEALKKGMDMIYSSFTALFEKLGVETFGEAGDKFDPNIHNAVMHLEDEEHGESEIVQVFSKGYKLGDRIIRPAMVQVAN